MGSTAKALSKNISVPRDLLAKLDEKLALDDLGTIPKGAYTDLFVSLGWAWVEGRVKTAGEQASEALDELGGLGDE